VSIWGAIRQSSESGGDGGRDGVGVKGAKGGGAKGQAKKNRGFEMGVDKWVR